MGRKITIDSATLFNKSLEMIEARWLFGVPMDQVDVVVHPQSIVHSLVEFVDGSQLAQLSHSDMCFPIQYAITYPDRLPNRLKPLCLATMGQLRRRQLPEWATAGREDQSLHLGRVSPRPSPPSARARISPSPARKSSSWRARK